MTRTNSIQQSFNFLQIAEVKLVYVTKVKPSERLSIKTSKEAHRILFQSWAPDNIEHIETCKMLLLSRSNKVLGITTVSKGGVSASLMDTKVIFQYALKANACGFIIAHNHPSGNVAPSESDLKITRKIKEAGEILDIQLLDHIILTPEEDVYTSLADEGHI
jgi:DNA repair protein RadC